MTKHPKRFKYRTPINLSNPEEIKQYNTFISNIYYDKIYEDYTPMKHPDIKFNIALKKKDLCNTYENIIGEVAVVVNIIYCWCEDDNMEEYIILYKDCKNPFIYKSEVLYALRNYEVLCGHEFLEKIEKEDEKVQLIWGS